MVYYGHRQLTFIACFLVGVATCTSCEETEGSSCSDDTTLLQVNTNTHDAGMLLTSQGVEGSALMEQSFELEHRFATAARSMPAGATKSFLESFKICGQCSSFQRFGEDHDGGYLMCMDYLHKGTVKSAYSLGVEHHDKWSQDVVNLLGVAVNQFDCTVDGSDCQGCKFFKKCVVSADGNHPLPGHESEGWSLEQALSQTGQGNATDASLLMKMDIESSEWPIYASEPAAVLAKFGELIVEFHNLRDEGRHAEYLQAMQHISDAGFKIVHLHGNNYAGMYQTGSTTIPDVIEVTFIHGAARPEGCVADQQYNGLDAPNNPGAPELPMSHVD